MDFTDRLRAVVAIQQEVVAAGLDPDAVAQLVAERAQAVMGADGGAVELLADGRSVCRGMAGEAVEDPAMGSVLRIPLEDGEGVFGTLKVAAFVADAFDAGDLEVAAILGGITSLQLGHACDYAQAWRDGRQDALTGLLNRRAYDETLAREAARARRHERELALCLFDLDDFKAVNDTAGHLAGDEVLRRFAGVLRHVRGEDFAFRVGGDEFALVLPETDFAGAETVSQRLLERADVPASVGTATLSEADEPAALHAAADAELYGAKRRRG
jgi:diguanylate cyclase (GGDEF)-like protein